MTYTLKDNHGREYQFTDIQRFKQHLIDFHSNNGIGDGSLHEEKGYWFTVTEVFFKAVMEL